MAIPFALVLLVVAIVVAYRRRDRASFMLDAVALVLIGATFVSTARVIDEPFDYLLRWTWSAGAVAWLGIGWTAIGVVRDVRAPLLRRGAIAVAIVAVVALTAASMVSAVEAEYPDPGLEQTMYALAGPTLAAARAAPGPIVIDSTSGIDAGALASGLLLELSRNHVAAGFPTDEAYIVGKHHVVDPTEARTRLTVAIDDQIAGLAGDPANKLIASHDRLAPDERAFFDRVNALLQPLDLPGRKAWLDAHPEITRRFRAVATARASRRGFRKHYIPIRRNRVIWSMCSARNASSVTPRSSSGARHNTPTLPSTRLWCTCSAASPVCSSG